MGTKSGPQYSVSKPLAQVLHRLPGSNPPLSCEQHETSWAAWFHRFHTQPLSLQEPAAEITLRARQLLLSSLQSSCPSFLKVPGLSHSPTFQPVWRLSKSGCDRVQLLPFPGVSWNLNFSGTSIDSPSGCVPPLCVSHFLSTSPSAFHNPGPISCRAALPALVGEGAGALTLLPVSRNRCWAGGCSSPGP